MLATLFEARTSTLKNIAGLNPSSPEFIQKVNEATQNLMRRGDWPGLIWPIRLLVQKGFIAWPRYVGQVRELNVCNTPWPVKNVWWEFMDRHTDHWHHWRGGHLNMRQVGKVATYNDVGGENRLIKGYALNPIDYGKTLTVFGCQSPTGLPIPDSGATLTLANPYGTAQVNGANVFVRRIDRVLKDVTVGPVVLYSYDPATNIYQDLGFYEGSETNPDYVRSELMVGCTSNCAGLVSVLALIKLKFIPVVADTDLVLIENLEALKKMMQSIRFSDSGDITNSRQYELDAIRALNLGLTDDSPLDQMPVETDPFQRTHIGHQHCF